MTRRARQVVKQLYIPVHAFLKAGIGLIDIVDHQHRRFDLLHARQPERSDKLIDVIDRINRRAGKGTVFLAAQDVSKPGYIRQQYTSPQYTTKWSDLANVIAQVIGSDTNCLKYPPFQLLHPR